MATRVAVLGLGEAGTLFAAGLAEAGVHVSGWDPKPPADPEAARLVVSSAAEAVGDADVVLSINAADVAESVASQVAGHLRGQALYADLNTAAPSVKTGWQPQSRDPARSSPMWRCWPRWGARGRVRPRWCRGRARTGMRGY